MDFNSQFWLNVKDRRNVWFFYYFVAKNLYGYLSNFSQIANIPSSVNVNPLKNQPPTECFSREEFYDICSSLYLLIDIFEGEAAYIRKDDIDSIKVDLHKLVDILPYLNARHYTLSRYEYENYRGEVWCSLNDMHALDRTIANRILPVMSDFAECSQFPAGYFMKMYSFPCQDGLRHHCYEPCAEWRRVLVRMAKSWEWLATREVTATGERWEDVPPEVYYGLHLFAEYLPEMQND